MMCAYHIFYTYINVDIYVTFKGICTFRKKKYQTPLKPSGPNHPVSQNIFKAVN